MDEGRITTLKPGMLVTPSVDFWFNVDYLYWNLSVSNAPPNWSKTTDPKLLLMKVLNESCVGLVLSDETYETTVDKFITTECEFAFKGFPLKARLVKILFGTREVVFTINNGFVRKMPLHKFDEAFEIHQTFSSTCLGG